MFHGRVQGVGFRAFCHGAASGRSVRGWVRNLPDGDVEMEAEASPETLEALLAHLSSAHPWARVERMDARDVPPLRDEAEGFSITTY